MMMTDKEAIERGRKPETLYTLKEISIASGIKQGTINTRRQRLKLESNKGGYTYAEVKMLIKKRPLGNRHDPRKTDALRTMLKNDGAI